MSAGSYIFNLQQRSSSQQWNQQAATGAVLDQLQDAPVSLNELQSSTGMPAEVLKRSLNELLSGKLIAGSETGYTLTELGSKAKYFVAR